METTPKGKELPGWTWIPRYAMKDFGCDMDGLGIWVHNRCSEGDEINGWGNDPQPPESCAWCAFF